MNEPTYEQREEFWEWCGFRQLDWAKKGWHYELTKKVMNWTHPSFGRNVNIEFLPRIDLKELFNYAIPKAKMDDISFQNQHQGWRCWLRKDNASDIPIYSDNHFDTPDLALFWALWELKARA